MKHVTFWSLVVLLDSLRGTAAQFQWNVDERCCNLYRKSQRPKECEIFRRRLGMGTDDTNSTVFQEDYENHEFEEISISLLGKGNTTATEEPNNGRLRGNIHESTNTDAFSALSDNYRGLKATRETFVMRLHWERGFCWQEEMIERRWCMQCKGDDCKAGGILWIQECANIPQQRFEWVSIGGRKGRLKVANKNLCLTKSKELRSNFYYKLRRCSSSNKQLFARSSLSEIFELYPHNDRSKCVNQHHHPKWREEIRTTTCFLARKWHTNRWKMIYKRTEGIDDGDDNNNGNGDGDDTGNGGNTRLSLKRKECTDEWPCGLCEGDCDSNKQCRGNLKCYQRDNDGTSLFVPGCSGTPKTGRDYCYRP